MKRLVLIIIVIALAGCERSESAHTAGKVAAAAGSSTLDEIKAQACACKDQDCVTRVSAELTIERRRFERTYEEAEACLDKVEGADRPGSADSILGTMREFKDKICACTEKGCVEKVETEMMEWAMKNMEKMKDVKPTKAQDEAADKIEDEMEKCKERIGGGP